MHFMPLLIVFTGDHESTGYHGSSGQQGNRRMDALCSREGKQNEVRSWGAVSDRSGPLSDRPGFTKSMLAQALYN